MGHAPERNKSIQIGRNQDIGVFQELAELHRRGRGEVWVGILQDTLLSIRVEVVHNNDAVVSTTSAQLPLLLKVDVIGAVLVGPGSLLSETFLRAIAVVIKSDVAVPRG